MSANAQMTAKGDAMYYVHSFLCLLIMFGFGQLPPVEPLTALGMRLIGIFLGLLYGWIFIDIVWPSMAGLLALMLVGGMKPVALLNRSFGDPIVVMMFFILVRTKAAPLPGFTCWNSMTCMILPSYSKVLPFLKSPAVIVAILIFLPCDEGISRFPRIK